MAIVVFFCLQQSFGFVGPLNFKLRRSLTKLRKEAETIKELLNMVANVYEPPNLEEGRLSSVAFTTAAASIKQSPAVASGHNLSCAVVWCRLH